MVPPIDYLSLVLHQFHSFHLLYCLHNLLVDDPGCFEGQLLVPSSFEILFILLWDYLHLHLRAFYQAQAQCQDGGQEGEFHSGVVAILRLSKIGLRLDQICKLGIVIINLDNMGSLIAQGACCCFACCCKECADGFSRWLGPEKVTKIFYFFLVVVFVVPAIFIFFFLNKWKAFMEQFSKWIYCPGYSATGDQFGCIGQSVVFRMSLALLILFAIMLIFMMFRARLSMVVNEGCFCLKYLLVVGIVIGFLWVNDQVFYNFAEFSKYGSIVYMILQSIILIDLFYLAGIKLVKKYDQGQTQYACYLVTLSIIVEAIAIGLNVLGYIYFRSESTSCTSTLWVNIITSIMLVLLPAIQCLHFNVQNSLLTTALVSMFISYLGFIAQFSYGGSQVGQTCVRMDVGSLIADIVCSTFFFVCTMYGSIMGGTGNVKVTRNGNINQAMGVGSNEPAEAEGDKKYQPAAKGSHDEIETDAINQAKYTESWQWAKWHFYMCIASIYISMLVTNWISVDLTTGVIQSSNFGFWVRVIIAWATFLLYIWTLIAPRVCPGRDFVVE